MKALAMQLNKAGCETMITIEMRYISNEKFSGMGSSYKIIYWLTPKNSNERKQKIEEKYQSQVECINALNTKLKEWKNAKTK